jgi:phosphonate transport system ATP-binding protein
LELTLQGLAARHPAARADTGPALQQIDLAIASGERVAVIGASGAGKTTLLQVMGLALRPSGGTIRLAGSSPWQLPVRELQRLRGRLFLAPQVPPLPPRQRVVTSVLAGRLPAIGLWASLSSLFYPSDIPAAHDALDRFDLADKLFERVDRLSGGERQRVALARALLAPAGLWLVDEPLSALDPTHAQQALQALLQLSAERRITLVASLHQVELALAHFPRIVGLQAGRVAFDLPRAEVTPAHLEALYGQGNAPIGLASDPFSLPALAPVISQCR